MRAGDTHCIYARAAQLELAAGVAGDGGEDASAASLLLLLLQEHLQQ